MSVPNYALRRIRMSGFRGALAPLEVPLTKGKDFTSGVVHGKNGSGKSSITDAWEFVHTGKIRHLAREGAGPESYPHRKASVDESFVEVEFADPNLGTVRWYTDGRMTKETKAAKKLLDALRRVAPHPCQIRFEDLSRFVYLTKTERHDALAELMGFTPQVETQKALRRVHRNLDEQARTRTAKADQAAQAIATLLQVASVTDEIVLGRLNAIFIANGVPVAQNREDLPQSFAILTERVTQDVRARELAAAEALERCLKRLAAAHEVEAALLAYGNAVAELSTRQATAIDSLLISLYDAGAAVLAEAAYAVGDPCPLCGQAFAGDLKSHVELEMRGLHELKALRDSAEARRRAVLSPLPQRDSLHAALEAGLVDAGSAGPPWNADALLGLCRELDSLYARLREFLAASPERLGQGDIQRITTTAAELSSLAERFTAARATLLLEAEARIAALREDNQRAQLVSDHTLAMRAADVWGEWVIARGEAADLAEASRRCAVLVDDYIAASIANVERRFRAISSDVERYFEILEEHTEGIRRPALRLLLDQDRAVVLEVEFRGDVIAPAYKYLSESQLNSFGLAVFLASARRFNPQLRFLILDDVVNSFDGQKRPQVIKLLKQEFSDYQVLILTHDKVWWGQLTEAFKNWTRLHITRYEPASGPVTAQGRSDIEEVEQFLANDAPRLAGGILGPLLERKLQELCEGFEVYVAYNQRNEYTLAPLVSRFCVRVREKLGATHPVTVGATALEADLGFRNLMAHWKNPDIELTTEELGIVVTKWRALESLVSCSEPKCHGVPKYDGKAAFECGCGALRLSK